ncbi:histone-fold-containing protein [Exidia glandulosa HHB12029]|uniref:Histone-fold-containing protein n=1 Tax=Exidia glandulosa HHB12029 TaxID=1314781 RepID=A0A165C9M2_EXIGL|nr:histone-fold-containing protein [Exidia glandulosa HHB12029]KZV82073.1 histone-fold-containing protein [Exidia glandulosa HHB12029]
MSQQRPFVQSGDSLDNFLRSFWQRQIDAAEQETPDVRHPPLPLARIKKVMKSDPEVKMIAADAPILFCKACEIFIAEITARAFIIADSDKRRTLSRSDIAKAIGKSDQFDFLIDIIPREDVPSKKKTKKEEDVTDEQRHRSLSNADSTIDVEVMQHGGDQGVDLSGVGQVEPLQLFDQLSSLINPQRDL